MNLIVGPNKYPLFKWVSYKRPDGKGTTHEIFVSWIVLFAILLGIILI